MVTLTRRQGLALWACSGRTPPKVSPSGRRPASRRALPWSPEASSLEERDAFNLIDGCASYFRKRWTSYLHVWGVNRYRTPQVWRSAGLPAGRCPSGSSSRRSSCGCCSGTRRRGATPHTETQSHDTSQSPSMTCTASYGPGGPKPFFVSWFQSGGVSKITYKQTTLLPWKL